MHSRSAVRSNRTGAPNRTSSAKSGAGTSPPPGDHSRWLVVLCASGLRIRPQRVGQRLVTGAQRTVERRGLRDDVDYDRVGTRIVPAATQSIARRRKRDRDRLPRVRREHPRDAPPCCADRPDIPRVPSRPAGETARRRRWRTACPRVTPCPRCRHDCRSERRGHGRHPGSDGAPRVEMLDNGVDGLFELGG